MVLVLLLLAERPVEVLPLPLMAVAGLVVLPFEDPELLVEVIPP